MFHCMQSTDTVTSYVLMNFCDTATRRFDSRSLTKALTRPVSLILYKDRLYCGTLSSPCQMLKVLEHDIPCGIGNRRVFGAIPTGGFRGRNGIQNKHDTTL